MRHFAFGHDHVLAQFWVILAEFHFASRVFGLGILGCCIEIAGFLVFQLYNFLAAFFRCHVYYLLIILMPILC